MLYHWYELDLEAKMPAESGQRVRARSRAPIIDFDSKLSRARAAGGGCLMEDAAFTATADNDTQPDTVAAKLRAAGLGVIGDPAHRAHRGSYSLANTRRRVFETAASTIDAMTLRAAGCMQKLARQFAANRSHTMVSNDLDDLTAASNDAKRQRFESSGQ